MPDEPAALLSDDLTCMYCGYNLRGLTTDKLCPECGTPIGRSLHGNLLRFADPTWLQKLHLGTTLKLWCIAAAVVVAGGAAVLASVGTPWAVTVQYLLSLVFGIVSIWATFLITTQEPRISLQEDTVSLRRLIRLCAVASLLGGNMVPQMPASVIRSSIVIAAGALQLLGTVALIGELVYYRRFARRVPDEKLVRSTSVVLWGLPICMAFMTAGALLMGIAVASGGATAVTSPAPTSPAPATPVTAPPGPGLPPPFNTVSGIASMGAMCVALLGMAVFGIWHIVLLFKYRRAFRQALDEAHDIDENGLNPSLSAASPPLPPERSAPG